MFLSGRRGAPLVASSLLFLGIGIVLFIVVFGVMIIMAAAILGAVFATLDSVMAHYTLDPFWAQTYGEVRETSGMLILMIMSLGVVILILKIIMVASARGRD